MKSINSRPLSVLMRSIGLQPAQNWLNPKSPQLGEAQHHESTQYRAVNANRCFQDFCGCQN